MNPTAPAKPEPSEGGSPNPPLARRATVGEVGGSTAYNSARPRRKSVTSACERCRRRKIRCDGDHPCATCARFSVACIRLNRHKDRMSLETQAALEERVRKLEARLAESSAQGGESSSDALQNWAFDVSPGHRSSHPVLRLETKFGQPMRSYSDDNFGGELSANELTSPDIPMIEITGCESPGSMPLSPSPSLLSSTSRVSSPDPFLVSTPVSTGPMSAQTLAPPKSRHAPSPPITPPINAVPGGQFFTDENGNIFSPHLSIGEGMSRRSSVSSLGLDQDLSTMNLEFPEFQDPIFSPENTVTPSIEPFPDPNPTYVSPVPTIPPKAEAERLGRIFFEFTQPVDIPIDRATFQTCVDAVYSLPAPNSPLTLTTAMILDPTQYTLNIAKFQVYMVMAIALKMSGSNACNGMPMETLYRLAMQQTAPASFWENYGGVEMAILLAVFAKAEDLT